MISINLLSFPSCMADGEAIHFPYKKAEALFYYLVSEKSISRDSAVALLWENDDEMNAKKNLRHAIYIIKKVVHPDIILSEKKYLLSLNPNIAVKIDAELYGTDPSILYDEFMKDFYVKNAPAYEDWIQSKRETFQSHFLEHLFLMLQKSDNSLENQEQLFEKYVQLDSFDERAYVCMMQYYMEHTFYHKGIKLYQRLQKLLNDELGITPLKTTSDLYHTILNLWLQSVSNDEVEEAENLSVQINDTIHADVKAQLKKSYHDFQNGTPHNILLLGENGAGKSHIVTELLSEIDTKNLFLLTATCFQAEKHIPLQPWNDIIFQLDLYITEHNISFPQSFINSVAQFFPTFGGVTTSNNVITEDFINNFQYRACKNSIIRIIFQIAQQKKLLFFIDNINNMDTAGQDLVSSILRLRNPQILFICTSLNTPDYDTVTFFSSMTKEDLFYPIYLERLSLSETEAYIQQNLVNIPITKEMIHKIHKETEGNFFFLTEAIKNMKENNNINTFSMNAQNILDDRLNGLSHETRILLDTISIFHDYVTLKTLSLIHNKEELEILNSLEELKDHALIVEQKNHKIPRISFTHNKMRSYVSGKLSPSKSKILHNKAGEALEQQLDTPTISSLKSLLYHYKMAGNQEKYIYYQIKNIDKYSSLNFELYPVLNKSGGETAEPAMDIMQHFDELEQNLANYKEIHPDYEDYEELFSILMHAKCRYCIATGKYTLGLQCYDRGMATIYTKKNTTLILKYLHQIIYYAIQINDGELLEKFTKDGIMLSLNANNMVEHAFFHRLRGLSYIFEGKYSQAFSSIIKSIDYFEQEDSNKQLYYVNVAAAYNYLGESNRKQGQYKQAIQHYQKAISLCSKKGTMTPPTFYTNIALAYIALDDMVSAKEYLILADSTYNSTITLMGKSTTKILLAYMKLLENSEDYREYILQAEETAEILKSPIEKGIILTVKSKMAAFHPEDFPKNATAYIKESNEILDQYPGIHIKL